MPSGSPAQAIPLDICYNLPMRVIEVRDLTKKYKDLEAVRGISFEVEKGEIFGILGPNGAGKTTTLEIIECLKRQSSGVCRVLGIDSREHPYEIKKKIGVQLQSSEYFNDLHLDELLRLFAGLYGHSVETAAVLKLVGLEDRAKSRVGELSGGQKQRFTIASALVHKPEILFLDEPTTGLDPSARRSMWELIKDLHAQGITIVLTTHYMEEAEYLCQRVAIMDQGKILQIDQPRKLIENLSKTYNLSFFVPKALPENFFEGAAGIAKVHNEFPKVLLEIENVGVLPEIVAMLGKAGINYSSLNLKTATLEDVYLQLTGHEYQN